MVENFRFSTVANMWLLQQFPLCRFSGDLGGGACSSSRASSVRDAPSGVTVDERGADLSSPEMLKSLAKKLDLHHPSGAESSSASSNPAIPESSSSELWKGRTPHLSSPPLRRRGSGGRSSSDLVVNCKQQQQDSNGASPDSRAGGANGSASPGSVVSPGSAGSSNKPPIFPAPDRSSNGLKIALKKTTEGASPSFLRGGSHGGEAAAAGAANGGGEVPAFMKEFAGVVRRRSAATAPAGFNPNEPAPPRPADSSARPHSAILPGRKLSAAAAATVSPEMPRHSSSSSSRRRSDFMMKYEQLANRASEALSMVEAMEAADKEETAPPQYDASPLSPEPEDVEFDEEEVLKTCQNFLKDYDDSKRRKSLTMAEPPVPKPRGSIAKTPNCQEVSFKSTRRVSSSMLGSAGGSPTPSIRNRSSSLTLLDNRAPRTSSAPGHSRGAGEEAEFVLKPILKKSSEDLDKVYYSEHRPVPILKNKDSSDSAVAAAPAVMSSGFVGGATSGVGGSVGGGILKKKSADDGQPRPDHIRIRSPSPDSSGRAPRPILRSRNNSTCDERMSSPEPAAIQSILKRRSSTEDLDLDPASRSSPEPQGILKRKYSSANTSGSHTPESTDGSGGRPISSILKRGQQQQQQHQGSSLEDVEFSSERIKSILKKKQFSTDDELEDQGFSSAHERPRSILKSRKSEESLSPLSDPNEGAGGGVLVVANAARKSPGGGGEFEPRPILKHKDSREDLASGSRSRTLSPTSHE